MPETTHGGRRPGAGRKPGSTTKKPSPERALLALCKVVEDAIRNKDWRTAREYTEKLHFILSYIPDNPSAEK
jgi:hypothetical protein